MTIIEGLFHSPQTLNGHVKKDTGSLIRLPCVTTVKWLQIGAALMFLSILPSLILSSIPDGHPHSLFNYRYTSKNTSTGTVVYAITLRWPQDTLTLGAPTPTSKTTVSLLGYQGAFTYSARPSGGMDVNLQGVAGGRRPCQWGWVFRLEQVVPAHAPRAVKWRGAPLVGPAEVNPVMPKLARP